jgi:hypothetical protein
MMLKNKGKTIEFWMKRAKSVFEMKGFEKRKIVMHCLNFERFQNKRFLVGNLVKVIIPVR